jgi:hypothetical protein
LHFRLPPAPKVAAVRVERITGACPAAGSNPLGELVAEPAPTPGEIAVSDSTDLTPGPWCYVVRIQLSDRDFEPALVQVEVPAATAPPPPAVP